MERIHDAPHRAEQTDVWTGRADGREHRQVLFEPIDFAHLRDTHRTLRSIEQLRRRDAALLAEPAEFSEARFENALHAAGAALAGFDRAKQHRQVTARPEVAFESVRVAARAPDQ